MRIGILRGTFDPVHAGHIDFALQAADQANLDKVYFLVEQPEHKKNVTDLKHRAAMVKAATKSHDNVELLEINGNTIAEILPKLKAKFPAANLVFLMGSDIAKTLPDWPDLNKLCENELVIALRSSDEEQEIKKMLGGLPVKPKFKLIDSNHPHTSSSKIRDKQTIYNKERSS